MWRRVRGCLTALVSIALLACPRPGARDAGTAVGASASAALSIRVQMPEGWAAQSAPDGSFQAGPPGRRVLRIDRRSGTHGSVPSTAQLKSEFEREVSSAKSSVKIDRSTELSSIVVFSFTPRGSDSGEQLVMLGAKRVDDDLFLCATLPGRDLLEAQDAARACEELSVERPAVSGD